MASTGIEVLDRADPTVAAALGREIDAFNMAETGIEDARDLFAVVRDENGALRAGVDGWTWGATAWVEHLWVSDDSRGRGLGGALLEAVEGEARRRGCVQIALATHSFHAPAFYRRHGFEECGVVPGYPRGHAYVLMRKPLVRGAADERASSEQPTGTERRSRISRRAARPGHAIVDIRATQRPPEPPASAVP